jgi:hypothetical protein
MSFGEVAVSITLLHADVHEGTFALRRQVISDILALRNAAIHLWYEEGAQPYEPVTGCHTGMMDLSQVDLPVDATYYRDPAARRAAALTCERRPDRLCWNAGRPDRRVDRLTPTRHRPDTATRRMSLLLPSGTGWE